MWPKNQGIFSIYGNIVVYLSRLLNELLKNNEIDNNYE